MDEAFEKLDPDNIYKIIQFYHSLGLQLIMAAPKTHQALYQETFDTLISLIRVGRAIQATPQHFNRDRSEEHTSELQSLMRLSYAVFCLQKKTKTTINTN